MSARSEISGYVLAGGRSSRMQREGVPHADKALLQLGGETLLERTVRKLRAVCNDVAILGGPPERCARLAWYGRVVGDAETGMGPLAGLAAALTDARHEWLLIAAVDTPLLPVEVLQKLSALALQDGQACVAVCEADRLQPLPLVLHRSALPIVQQAIAKGERRLLALLQQIAMTMPQGMRVLILQDHAQEPWFTNINTPMDIEAAASLLQSAPEAAE